MQLFRCPVRLAFLSLAVLTPPISVSAGERTNVKEDPSHYDYMLPNESLRRPAMQRTPMTYVTRGLNRAEWQKLPSFFNEVSESIVDPITGKSVTRKTIKVKLPLGINVPPTVPPQNPMTYERWQLGKKLYYDPILSSDNTVSCSTCHSPDKGFGDQSQTSTGISGKLGGMNAPTVINSAFNHFQFWDGRAESLEHQSQGPVGNPVEMFAGTPEDAWHAAIKRIRKSPSYAGLFEKEFGHPATRDAVAKAIATFERTVIVGNSIEDRAAVAARTRAEDEESTKFDPIAKDYQTVLNDAFASKDSHALKSLGLDPAKDQGRVAEVAKSISNGRVLYFNKARCNSCHVGETYTDHTFHNLGVGVVNGKLSLAQAGRFAALPIGAKDPAMYGAYKTPGLACSHREQAVYARWQRKNAWKKLSSSTTRGALRIRISMARCATPTRKRRTWPRKPTAPSMSDRNRRSLLPEAGRSFRRSWT